MGGFIGKNTKRGTTTVSKKHVVIVGASGELGTAVSSAFIKEGHNVYGISSRPSHTSVHIPLNQALSYAESSKGAFDELSKHIEKGILWLHSIISSANDRTRRCFFFLHHIIMIRTVQLMNFAKIDQQSQSN
eukprot:TRINITY_DN3748_c0_g1_i10.p1 TRINITY_DN3748_c0_g1~~TRINITY_DN3748_c0_g1_i10.p1  ORF type:complete len:132 (+),score=20.23 TRINITY_DN3748_c0_g1_i10:64-459(+)